MALKKEHRAELRKIQSRQSRKFHRTGVAVKGSLKGTVNTARPVGVKRETMVDHRTFDGQTVKLNVNAKAKINANLGVAIEKSNLRTVTKAIDLFIEIKDASGNTVATAKSNAPVVGNDIKKACGDIFYDMELKLAACYDNGLHAIETGIEKALYNKFDNTIIKRDNLVFYTTWHLIF